MSTRVPVAPLVLAHLEDPREDRVLGEAPAQVVARTAEVAGVGPVLVQMWVGVSPVLVQMWVVVGPVPVQMWVGVGPVPVQTWWK